MSRQVRFYFNFKKINEKAQSEWQKMSKVWEDDFAEKNFFHREGVEDDYNDKPLGLLWLNNDEKLSIEEMNTSKWNLENTGQEWTNIIEWEEAGFYAYSESYRPPYPYSFPPLKGIKWILTQLEQYDKNLFSVIDYECQDLEFTGIIVFKGTKQYCGFEYCYEEILDMMVKEYPEKLSKKWNKETNDWIDWVSKEFFLNNVSSYLGDNIKYNYIEKLNIE